MLRTTLTSFLNHFDLLSQAVSIIVPNIRNGGDGGVNDNYSKNNVNVFWVVLPCSLADICQRFSGACCLHHRGEEQVRIVFL
jgi:hypothetical protein